MLRAMPYADKISQPGLHVQGTMDMIPSMDQALWMERALRESGNEQVHVELIERMSPFLCAHGAGLSFRPCCGSRYSVV
jgi:hypothetical protein